MEENIFDEDGALTAGYLLSRGFCCGNRCRNCPYTPRHGGDRARAPNAGADRTTESEATEIGTR